MIRLGRSLALPLGAVAALAWASAASAREVLTPEEQAERELEAKRNAPPVLVVEPAELRAKTTPGETRSVRLTVRNAGGGKLSWSVLSAPRWARPDNVSGRLEFEEETALVLLVDPGETGVGPEGGEARGMIVIEAPGVEGSPAKVQLIVEVAPSPGKARREAAGQRAAGEPFLACMPAEISGTVKQGEKLELPLTVRNAGSGKMSWYISAAPEWIDFDAKSGELGAGDERRLFLKIDAMKLDAGSLEDKVVVESTRGSERVASLPVQLKVKYRPAGAWTLRAMAWVVTARTYVQGEGFSPMDRTSDSREPGQPPGMSIEWCRSWESRWVDLGLVLGFAKLRTAASDTRWRRECISAGLALAFPSGSRLRGFVSSAYLRSTLFEIYDLGGPGLDAHADYWDGMDLRAGVILALGRRCSLEAHLRFSTGGGRGFGGGVSDAEYDGMTAYIGDVTYAFGAGLAIHY